MPTFPFVRSALWLALFGLILSSAAFAADSKRASDNTKHISSASESYGGAGSWALGFSDTQYLANGQSLSALFSSRNDWVQAFLNIPQTRGVFGFAVGGAYKFTVAGDRRMGFHVGPAMAVGTVAVGGSSEFSFSVAGVAGGHYTLFERLLLSVDGGPILSVVEGNVNFRLRPMGELLGLSLHYLF